VAITTIPGASGSDLTTLTGTELADTLVLTANSLYIDSKAGADTVTAASALDKLTALVGGDADSLTFSGDLTNANLDLGDGNDITSFADFSGSLEGGTGNDLIDVNRAAEKSTIKGGTGNDTFTFDTTVDSSLIWGNSDDDTVTITGATTGSTVYGGKQQDVITVAAATNSKIRGDKGNDTITVTGSLSNVVIQGNGDVDQINVSSASATKSTVFGGQGADDINITGAGAVVVRGDKGGDDIDITANGKYTVEGGAGADNIDSNSTKAGKYYGGDDNDTITIDGSVSSGQNYASGDAGNDNITGGTGGDSIDGGVGKDTLTGGGGSDTIYGKAGADSIDVSGATAGKLNVLGGADNDTIVVLESTLNTDDVIKGELGTDSLKMATTDGLIDTQFKGVSSVETVLINGITAGATVTFGSNAQSAGITKIDTGAIAANADAADYIVDATSYSSAVSLTITGSKLDNDKDLRGGGGADTINSGAAGQTFMTGKGGVDLFAFTTTHAGNTVTDLSGTDNLTLSALSGTVTATVSADLVSGVATKNQAALAKATLTSNGFDVNMSAVTAGANGFIITNSGLAATLQGSALNDSITGGIGSDSLKGNDGADIFVAGLGSDTVSGGAGNDTITTSATGTAEMTALDSIDGGTGTDIFQINAAVTASAAATATVDMDRISNLLTFKTSGIGDNGENQTIVFSPIAETTAQTVVVDASTLDSAGDSADLVLTNNAASATTVFSVTGGSGADTIAGSNGKDTITGGAGADVIDAGAGADDITLAAGSEDVTQTGGKGATAQSVAWTAETFTDAGMLAGETITFGNGIDVYSGWTDGGDTFATGVTTMATLDASGDLEGAAAEQNFQISGSWDADTLVFTQADAGTDSLVLGDSQTANLLHADNTADFFIILNSATLAAADFV
jgi:Ca2+-binding RTX toxin-like protein